MLLTFLSKESKRVCVILANLHLILVRVDQLDLARTIRDRRGVAFAIEQRLEVAHLRCAVTLLLVLGQIRNINLRLARDPLRGRV